MEDANYEPVSEVTELAVYPQKWFVHTCNMNFYL